MRRKVISMVLVVTMILLTFMNGVSSEAAVRVTKKNDKVCVTVTSSLYTSYSTKSKKIGTLKKNEVINRIGVTNSGWTKVVINGKNAYVLSKYVKLITTTKKNDKVFVTSSISVHSSYTTSSKKLGSIKKSEVVQRTGVTNNGWTKIVYKNKTAYVSSSKVKVITVTKKSDKVYASSSVSVYSSYTTASKKLGSIKKGGVVQRTGITNNGWTKILYKKKTAYVPSKNITTKKPTSLPSNMIDPKHFSQYDPQLKGLVKSVDANTIVDFKSYMGYFNHNDTSYVWSDECKKIAVKIIRGDLKWDNNYRIFRMTGMTDRYRTTDALDSFLGSVEYFPECKEVAIVRITYIDRWNSGSYKFVCVAK